VITVLNIIGTRPEAIKMAPVIKELEKFPAAIRSIVCETGQHSEMLKPILKFFDIHPQYDLKIMRPQQELGELTARLLVALAPVLKETNPQWILAQGDTTTVLAAALSAYYHRIPFGHVEAGLRTGDKHNPFPEEMNRRIADSLSDVFFAPTEKSRQALLKEGYADEKIVVTGNTVIDALLAVSASSPENPPDSLKRVPFNKKLILVTAHRRESFGEPFREICLAVKQLAEEFSGKGVHFVFPVHLNPNVQKPVREILSDVQGVSLTDSLDYISLVYLMKRAKLILTDSGGIQEEAPSLGIPVLVMRETTERPEGVEAGVVKLVGVTRSKIFSEAVRLLTDKVAYQSMVRNVNPYGDGRAAERIVSVILQRPSGGGCSKGHE